MNIFVIALITAIAVASVSSDENAYDKNLDYTDFNKEYNKTKNFIIDLRSTVGEFFKALKDCGNPLSDLWDQLGKGLTSFLNFSGQIIQKVIDVIDRIRRAFGNSETENNGALEIKEIICLVEQIDNFVKTVESQDDIDEATAVLEVINGVFENSSREISASVKNIIESISEAVKNVVDKVNYIFNATVNPSFEENLLTIVPALLHELVSTTGGVFRKLYNLVNNSGKDIIKLLSELLLKVTVTADVLKINSYERLKLCSDPL